MTSYSAAVLHAPGVVQIEERRVDRALAASEVLLEIVCAGICGTDVSIYSGDYAVPLPLILGHEFSARVADAPTGSWLAGRIGEAVVCEINNSCTAYGREDVCAACRRGMPTHCLRRTVTGIINHDGAFAQMLRVPAGNIHMIPPGFPLDLAVMIEPLAAAIRTFELTPLHGGETVVILGCGRLGRLIALVAHHSGARVIAVGRSSANLELIAPWSTLRVQYGEESNEVAGAVRIIGEEQLVQFIRDQTEGLGADIVVEATANNQNLALAQKLARPMGTVAMKSTSGVPVHELDTTRATVDELRYQSSRCGPFDKAIAFMQQHNQPDGSWITARFPLNETAAAIEAARSSPKVIISTAVS